MELVTSDQHPEDLNSADNLAKHEGGFRLEHSGWSPTQHYS